MRNALVQVLPAGVTLMIPIEPPLRLDERPFVFTATGHGSAVIRVVDSRLIAIHNPTAHLSPFLFFVASQPAAPAWLRAAIRIIGGL